MFRLCHRLCILLIPALMMAVLNASAVTVSVSYPQSGRELVNPYMGSAAWANDASDRSQPFTLVYANLLWSDFEKAEGVYDFDSFETVNHFDKWRREGKHLILRFVMDQPGDKNHRDIPDWLWEKTEKDGEAYKISYGRGYNPNYENPILIEAHAKAVSALGKRYGQDPFVAYVELGSLGHWGEWHVHGKLRKLPLSSIRDQYVAPYIDAFHNAKLMMRRPFLVAAKYQMGLFNDASGDGKSTETWLSWIDNGGNYDQTGEENALVSMTDAWRQAPVGGELTTDIPAEKLLADDVLEGVMRLFQRSHTSWIGPGSFVHVQRDGPDQKALDLVNRTIGYRLRVAECKVYQTSDGSVSFHTIWANSGVAPFYFGWIPSLRVTDGNGFDRIWPLDMNLLNVLPGVTVPAEIIIGKAELPYGEYTVYAGIVNPDTGKAGIELAMDTSGDLDWYELMKINLGDK